jgi:predicted RNA-binding protein with PUA-like domain
MPAYWILKSEPETFSYADLVKDGFTHWDGVRNHQAKNNLKAMQAGDWALIYHSVSEKAVVGIAKISKAHYPDPTDATQKWVAVGVVPEKALKTPVTLNELKAHPQLQNLALIRQSRLSVVPVSADEFATICILGGVESRPFLAD